MQTGELIDELMEDGHREIWFYWQDKDTDEENAPLTEWLPHLV